jgi:flagella basal body P-ring formation protein FlgA
MFNKNYNKTLAKVSTWFIFISLGCCLLPGGLLGAGSSPVSLTLKTNAVVSNDIIRMRDIADMNNETKAKFGNLVITVSPELGKYTLIPKHEIMEKLIGNGFNIGHQQVNGAETVKVTRKGLSVKTSFFQDRIQDYVIRNSKWKDGVTVSIVTAKDVVIPQSGVRWELTPANGQDFFGNILFKVRAIAESNNEEVFSNWIVAKLKIVKSVAISNRNINKNEVVGKDDLRWETREITAFTKNAIFDENEIVGHKAGRIIRPNSVITAGLMEKQFMVRRGGGATLVAKSNNIQATSSVRVLANAGMGDTVRVMNQNSKKIISAVVTGKNRVEVTVE